MNYEKRSFICIVHHNVSASVNPTLFVVFLYY